MADKRSTPDMPEGAPSPEPPRRKKRTAPTIDLTATEVPPDRDAAGPQADPQPQPDTPKADEAPHVDDDAAAASPVPPRDHPSVVTALAAGVAGAAATLLVLAALWFSGLLPQTTPAGLGTQASTDGKAIDALTQRMNALEAGIKKLPAGDAGLAGRLAAAENAMKSLGVALAALGHRSDDIAANAGQARERADAAMKAVAEMKETIKTNAPVSRADLEALDKRIAALESAAQSAQSDIGRIATRSSGNDRGARLALSAAALRDAVAAGAPYADELASVKELGGDDRALAPLEPFAKAGVPTAQVLAKELAGLLPMMEKIAGAVTPQGNFIERLQANASRLVRIQPVGAPQGDQPSAVLARIEADASKADIAAMLGELGRLSDAIRAPAQKWIDKARASQAALNAARSYAAETARALGSRAATQ